MKTILVAVSGGISAYKAADVISGLRQCGYEVHVITTKTALGFVTPTVLGAVSDGHYVTDDNVNRIAHIREAQDCDAFICVPATANIIAKFAYGIADDFVSSTFIAIPKGTPKIICPAMNTIMYESHACTENLSKLEERGCHIIEPAYGELACGAVGIGKLPKPRKIVEEVVELLDTKIPWFWPLELTPKKTTEDSNSFLRISLEREVEIPIKYHFGAFGAMRRFDRHRGVDLYAPVGSKVFAVQKGIVKDIRPWTGKNADCDWWEDTDAISIEGEDGLVVYGEISVNQQLKIGDEIKTGDFLGTVLRVLKKDKGRPTSMLHLELRNPGFLRNMDKDWGMQLPEGLLDPTPFLVKSMKSWHTFKKQ
jgi:3-polyprenyl-4-hydroxybenzoate decarboxylase